MPDWAKDLLARLKQLPAGLKREALTHLETVAEVLVLDEATSALDAESEHLVQALGRRNALHCTLHIVSMPMPAALRGFASLHLDERTDA